MNRVIPKYHEFLERFPDIRALAAAPLHDVLIVWSGLGYNRRAKFLHQAARQTMDEFDGILPDDQRLLTTLPGIGHNTAGAIVAYAYNRPAIFIETNIRTVYIHHFFNDATDVTDAQIRACLGETVDADEPRQWYWALMDYGSHLKATTGNAAQRSKSYTRQSKFEGSRRQIRGKVLAGLTQGPLSLDQLSVEIPDARLESVLSDLVSEGMLIESAETYQLAA